MSKGKLDSFEEMIGVDFSKVDEAPATVGGSMGKVVSADGDRPATAKDTSDEKEGLSDEQKVIDDKFKALSDDNVALRAQISALAPIITKLAEQDNKETTPQTPVSLMEKFGLDESFVPDLDEAVKDANSDSAKVLREMNRQDILPAMQKMIEDTLGKFAKTNDRKSEVDAFKEKYNASDEQVEAILKQVNSGEFHLGIEDFALLTQSNKLKEALRTGDASGIEFFTNKAGGADTEFHKPKSKKETEDKYRGYVDEMMS